ncbi:hypothetical protein KDK77_07290 [bacterium]|nr:hypothetical protein [bacterium]MCP5461821.1 hypothetical protein [bacterium]
MIRVDLSLLFFIYLLLSLGGIALLWAWFEAKHPSGRLTPYSKELFNCKICGYKYVDEIDIDITKCPRCKSLNYSNEARKQG